MEIRNKKFLQCLVLGLILLVTGCGGGGGSQDGAPTTRNAHEEGWRFTHDTRAASAQAGGDLTECQVCHGADFRGQGGVPSCFQCHLGGPPFNLHPLSAFQNPALPWASPINHGTAARQDIQSCQGCHGEAGGPGSNPRFNVTLRSLVNGCESTACHGARANVYRDFDAGLGFLSDLIPGPVVVDEVGHNFRAAHPGSGAQDPENKDDFFWFGHPIDLAPDVTVPLSAEANDLALLSHWDIGNITGCTLCHGVQGFGGAGPSCAACHKRENPVVSFPSPCFTCHEGPNPPAPPTVGFDAPYDSLFVDPDTGSLRHLQHQGMECQDHDNVDDCRFCHNIAYIGVDGSPRFDTVDSLHHLLINSPIPTPTWAINPDQGFDTDGDGTNDAYFCTTCHAVVNRPGGGFEVVPPQNCRVCHFNRPPDSGLAPLYPLDEPCP